MDKRTARCPVAHHTNLTCREGNAGQIVEDDVEALPGRRPERGRIAQENRREARVNHRAQFLLHQHLAARVSGLGVAQRRFGLAFGARRSLDDAGRRVHKPCDAGGFAFPREPDRPATIDFHRDVGIVLTQGII